MSKKFSQIKYLLKKAKAMSITAVDTDNNIVAYQNYRSGTSTTYKTTAVKRNSSHPFSLIPFCTEGTLSRYASKMSGRSFTAMSQNNVTDAKLNIDTTPSGTGSNPGGTKTAGYRPAKAILFVGTGTTTTPTSGITLLEYKKRGGTSYTYPFGKGTIATEETYPQVAGKLFTDLSSGNRTVSFKPEVAA